MKSAKETKKAIRGELQAIRKAIAAIGLQLRQLESESRTPAAPGKILGSAYVSNGARNPNLL